MNPDPDNIQITRDFLDQSIELLELAAIAPNASLAELYLVQRECQDMNIPQQVGKTTMNLLDVKARVTQLSEQFPSTTTGGQVIHLSQWRSSK